MCVGPFWPGWGCRQLLPLGVLARRALMQAWGLISHWDAWNVCQGLCNMNAQQSLEFCDTFQSPSPCATHSWSPVSLLQPCPTCVSGAAGQRTGGNWHQYSHARRTGPSSSSLSGLPHVSCLSHRRFGLTAGAPYALPIP